MSVSTDWIWLTIFCVQWALPRRHWESSLDLQLLETGRQLLLVHAHVEGLRIALPPRLLFMVLIVHRIGTAEVVVRVVLNDFLVLLPVIVGLTVHEAVRWSIDVLFLRELKLCLLLLAGHARYRAQNYGLDSVTTAIIKWLELICSEEKNSYDDWIRCSTFSRCTYSSWLSLVGLRGLIVLSSRLPLD